MRTVFAAFLLLHGLAHLVGFLAPWGLAPERPGSTTSPSVNLLFGGRVRLGTWPVRSLSLLWLALAVAFAAAAYGTWRQAPWALAALVIASIVSLLATLVWLPSARIGAVINAVLVTALTVTGVVSYRRDMRAARANASAASTVLNTAAGPIEYSILGSGAPVLAIHGTAGGWDQATLNARDLAPYGFRVVAPSRFGYLRTPLPANASPALEADAWATLLDSLRLPRVAVICWSAGAAPAFQFALRHPERVSRMVVFVPGAGGVSGEPSPGPPRWLLNLVLKWDFPMWAVRQLSPQSMLKLVAVPASLVPSLRAEDSTMLRESIDGLFPISARRNGMLYDARNQSGAEGVYPLERILAPALFVSAEDDLYRTLLVARRASARMPNARLMAFRSGGHLLLGRGPEIWPIVADFLSEPRLLAGTR